MIVLIIVPNPPSCTQFVVQFQPPNLGIIHLVAYTGVAVVGDMECTGSSCSPPNPPTAKYPALPLFFQPSHSVAFRVLPSVPPKRPEPPFKLEPLVAVVGAEGGSTPLGWDGMGENRDWVVWNKYIEGCSRGQQDGEQEGSTRGSRRAAQGGAGGQQKGQLEGSRRGTNRALTFPSRS
ncbi:unnamed protein product [Closterium sp. NIES-64]|nr:unnamed protein product [Closterium sp. NIES-64]